MAYILDANIFIKEKNLHYGFDFCPAFWNWLVNANKLGKVYSIERVKDQILAGSDELSGWAEERSEGFFVPVQPEDVPSLATVSDWANTNGYDPSAVYTFLSDADYYLTAQALSRNSIVVSHETPSNSRKKIKIPDACIAQRIKYMNPYTMLRLEGARFVLGPNPSK